MKDIDTTGIVRKASKPLILNYEQIKELKKSVDEMSGKTIVTEKKIQIEEDEWLNKLSGQTLLEIKDKTFLSTISKEMGIKRSVPSCPS